MTKEQLEALLGRPLTEVEEQNLDLYLQISTEALEELICSPITDSDSPGESETRVFGTRKGYRTAFVNIFHELSEVKLNGKVVTDYSLMQWDKRETQDWYNSLVFKHRLTDGEIEITGQWGFSQLPSDLALLLARIFDQISKQNVLDRSVDSKRVEDFHISFSKTPAWESLVKDNELTIRKYSMCGIPNVQHGKVKNRKRGFGTHWTIPI